MEAEGISRVCTVGHHLTSNANQNGERSLGDLALRWCCGNIPVRAV